MTQAASSEPASAFALDAEDMDQQDQQNGDDEAARGQHVHLGRIAIARDDVMDIDQIAPRQLEEAPASRAAPRGRRTSGGRTRGRPA